MLDKTYDPKAIEKKWRSFWLDQNLFSAKLDENKENFSIVIPPPNVTGTLHIGHALNNTLQDILCRYMRMQGKNVLWVPGTDHAGIATQNVVEKQLAKEGIKRKDLTREEFVERVWQWKEESGGAIINQLKFLGCSCDWEKERFTMDEGLSKAVREVFVSLYNEGLIYRGNYMINWCPRCESALADLEVEYPDEFEASHLYQLEYPLLKPKNKLASIIVETTRPETMLGDTAVAVHPEDERYKDLIGELVVLPIVGRKIPIIADDFVDPEFGSGAVKITPAHDPNDFEAGRRNRLEEVSVIGFDGKMTKEAGRYAGLDRFECRKKIIEDLKSQGVLLKIKDHQHKTGRCYRCSTITEPLISKQWFVKMDGLASEALSAVRNDNTSITPKTWEKTYYQWLENIRDWCISRQLWWGHQIPVWYCEECAEENVSIENPKQCSSCSSTNLKQDPDVLDTWFSSALWPFTTMGWPEKTKELKAFYPTSVLITGFDILFFWVARMMMMGLKIMGEVPFRDVYLHAMVRDEKGQKMSKTKGNVVDPLVLIEEYGADALRFSLTIMCMQGRDVNLSMSRIEGYRNFINKIWNAVRFVMMTVGDDVEVSDSSGVSQDRASRWIRSRLAKTISKNEKAYSEYQFSEICDANYHFFWDEYCAWYLEISKLQLKSTDDPQAIKNNLLVVLDASLRMLHPVIPFITEELWQGLPKINTKERSSLSAVSYPKVGDYFNSIAEDSQVEQEMQLVIDVVAAIRAVRSEKNIAPSKKFSLMLEGDSKSLDILMEESDLLIGLAKLTNIAISEPRGLVATKVVAGVTVHVELADAIDVNAEIAKYEKEISTLEVDFKKTSGKLSNKSFVEKAPPAVVEKERAKLKEFESKIAANKDAIAALKS